MRPVCTCHGEPMASNGKHKSGKQKFQCSVRNRERAADWYENCTNLQFAHRRLRNRRVNALRRMVVRNG